MSLASAADQRRTEVAGSFLTRIHSDPDFARQFDADPAAALQAHVPELAALPKERIAAALKESNDASERTAANPGAVGSPQAGFLGAVARTRAVRALASAVVSGIASAVASHFLKVETAEPIPE